MPLYQEKSNEHCKHLSKNCENPTMTCTNIWWQIALMWLLTIYRLLWYSTGNLYYFPPSLLLSSMYFKGRREFIINDLVFENIKIYLYNFVLKIHRVIQLQFHWFISTCLPSLKAMWFAGLQGTWSIKQPIIRARKGHNLLFDDSRITIFTH